MNEVRTITMEIVELLAAKQSQKIIIFCDLSFEVSQDVKDYSLNETFAFFYDCGLRQVLYVITENSKVFLHAKQLSEKNILPLKIQVFKVFEDAIKWLESNSY